MKSLHFLIKPASSLCNMRCKYCFYADVAENREVANLGMMSEKTSKELIYAAFKAVGDNGVVSFAFQGGEPTMAGLSYFKAFIALVNAQRPKGVQVSYALQTNGLAINEEWALFLKENNFLVGVSIDGGKDLHNCYRVDAKSEGTYSKVAKAFTLLKKCGVDVNVLCVVTRQCARHAYKTYSEFKKLGADYVQFIPCLDALQKERGSDKYSLRPEDYEVFLKNLFDEWYRDWEHGQYKSVRLFDDYVHLAMGMPSGTCATSGACGSYFVVEGDGSLYPCDFYVLDEWILGNVSDADFGKLSQSGKAFGFLQQSRQRPRECAVCKYTQLCCGGCKRDWVYKDSEPHNYYCEAFKSFFNYAGERIAYIAEQECRAMWGT